MTDHPLPEIHPVSVHPPPRCGHPQMRPATGEPCAGDPILAPQPYSLIIFDMDGVLTDHISSWMFVHSHFDVDNEQGYMEYRAGRIDDLEFMSSDIRLWREHAPGLTMADVQRILEKVPLMPGTREVFRELNSRGIRTAIISGGLEPLARRLGEELGITWIRSNGVETDGEGRLTGEGILRVSLRSKDHVVREIVREAGVPLERTAAVGDTRIDASMLKMCALGIAFDPKDGIVEESGDVVIRRKDLREILPYVLGELMPGEGSGNTMTSPAGR